MEVVFRTAKLQRQCSSEREMARTWGPAVARLLARRLASFEAAESLAELATLPQIRCHELTGDRDGQLAVDLAHPKRLIVEVATRPRPLTPHGGLDWARVTAVALIEVVDYH